MNLTLKNTEKSLIIVFTSNWVNKKQIETGPFLQMIFPPNYHLGERFGKSGKHD